MVRTATAQALIGEPGSASVLDATGYVTPRRQATVSAKVTGQVIEVLIEEGRRFETGKRELVINKGAQTEFAGLEVGRTIRLGLQDWTIVGVFVSGDAHELELWCDPEVLQGA